MCKRRGEYFKPAMALTFNVNSKMPKLESPRKSRPNPHKGMLSLRDVGKLGKSGVGKDFVTKRPGSGRKGKPL